MSTMDVEPLSPVPPGTGDSNGSPPVTDFATQIAQQANERLTELDARGVSLATQINALRDELARVQDEKAEAQRILDAALGSTGALQLARKADETPSAASEGDERLRLPAAETSEDALAEAERQVSEREGEQPEWTGGTWADDDQARRTREAMDEAARAWLATERPSASFTVADVKKALDVTRPTASAIVDRLQQAGTITEIDGGRAFVQVDAEAAEAAEPPVENEVTPEPESRPKQPSAATTGGRRSGTQVVTLEDVRDAVVDKFGPGVKFNLPQLGAAMGQNHRTIGKYVRALAEKGIVVRSGGERGPNVKYEYVPPDPRSAPRERPRHDGPRQLPRGAEAAGTKGRGVAVAHTGRPVGRSGRPGADRKKAQLGFRVKDRKK